MKINVEQCDAAQNIKNGNGIYSKFPKELVCLVPAEGTTCIVKDHYTGRANASQIMHGEQVFLRVFHPEQVRER